MFNVEVKWKNFRIHLGKLSSVLISVAGPEYAGLTAYSEKMIVHFKKVPSQEHLNRVEQEIDSLNEEEEAKKFKIDADCEKAVANAKANVLVADASTLIPAERKILMGIRLSNEDKASLLEKYPQ